MPIHRSGQRRRQGKVVMTCGRSCFHTIVQQVSGSVGSSVHPAKWGRVGSKGGTGWLRTITCGRGMQRQYHHLDVRQESRQTDKQREPSSSKQWEPSSNERSSHVHPNNMQQESRPAKEQWKPSSNELQQPCPSNRQR